MAWKDYETTLDVTPETATKKELEKLHIQYEIQYENEKRKCEPVNKGARADVFKKRFPKSK